MPKDRGKSKVRSLPGADQPPVEQPDPREKYARDIGQALEVYDQLITICCRGGYIIDILPLRDNRHEVWGVLDEAPLVYNGMTRPLLYEED